MLKKKKAVAIFSSPSSLQQDSTTCNTRAPAGVASSKEA